MNAAASPIFLSYALEDTEAARRVCDALRAEGLEVWFDKSELRGGDAWDASIRSQIKACALFLPVISANTQRRTEGYFRLEWRLAEQRSHLMAKGRPFLVPIAIDDTPEADAHVPEAFLEVQWSRLPGGASDAAFTARVRQLLSGEIVRPARREGARAEDPSPPKPRRSRFWTVAFPLAITLVALTPAIIKSWRSGGSDKPAAAASSPGPAAERVAKARELLDDDPFLTRRNVELAEQFALEAIAKEPSNAEAFAAAAWVNYRYLESNYEDTPRRRADLRSFAEKAKLLDPQSVHAELALCGLLMVSGNWDEANRKLQALSTRAPADLAVLRLAVDASARAIGNRIDASELSAESLDRLRSHSPLGRSYADSEVASNHWRKGRYVEADRVLDGVFASGKPVRHAVLVRLLVLEYGWGDLEAARRFADTIPAKLLLEDVFIAHLSRLALYSGEYEKALETLGRSNRVLLQEGLIEVPLARLRGDVHAAAGRAAAAGLQWREALKALDEQLAVRPDGVQLHYQRAVVLARLGERKEAAAAQALSRELGGSPKPGSLEWGREFAFHVAMGDRDGAIARVDRLVQRDYGRWPTVYNQLRMDPTMKDLRGDPRVAKILARGERWLAEMKASGGAAAGKPAPR